MIHSAISDYVMLFTIINIVEFVIGVFMFCVPDKRGVQEYLVCAYGGFFFGAIPLYMLFDTVTAVLIGCVFLSVILVFANYFGTKKVIPAGVVLLKVVLIFGSVLFEQYYSVHRLDFFLKAMLFSMLVLLAINLFYDLSEQKWRILISGLFGVLELGGAMIQFYRMDYTHFDKDFFSKRESVSLILCLLKVDFWIFNYQYLFLFIVIALLIIYFIWRKILQRFRRYADRRDDFSNYFSGNHFEGRKR